MKDAIDLHYETGVFDVFRNILGADVQAESSRCTDLGCF